MNNIRLFVSINCETGKTLISLPNDDGTTDKCTFNDFAFAADFMKNYAELSRDCKCKEDLLI